MKRRHLCISLLPLFLAGCGVYTFSGSTLPGHLKTVDIPLFVNKSLEPDIAEEITQQLTQQVLGANLLRIVSRGGDATINGVVSSYENKEYYYDIKGAREAEISEYIVRVSVAIEFMDNKKDTPLYKGMIFGEGIYNFDSENEEDGRRMAVKDIVEQILQNSVQGW